MQSCYDLVIPHVPTWIMLDEGQPQLDTFTLFLTHHRSLSSTSLSKQNGTPQTPVSVPVPAPVPITPQSTCLFLAASLFVLRWLRLTKGFWSSVAAIVSMRLLYNLVAGPYGTLIHVLSE